MSRLLYTTLELNGPETSPDTRQVYNVSSYFTLHPEFMWRSEDGREAPEGSIVSCGWTTNEPESKMLHRLAVHVGPTQSRSTTETDRRFSRIAETLSKKDSKAELVRLLALPGGDPELLSTVRVNNEYAQRGYRSQKDRPEHLQIVSDQDLTRAIGLVPCKEWHGISIGVAYVASETNDQGTNTQYVLTRV
ncbi:uncharacterized protein I303_104783 [Kwoniella dejecticola CBS 10117]|uniref:Uncharacterized protein n=1 Tax=Kwoniella dejecticola CBS 10117 TaxID=1296121 RepID=A0A1A6A4E8_9TREE|nr:uncharacterized protein I303_04236 [Kwoniella dejecticola CBS 10117]OBR84913.1 hypothetical protein I303_04236 [Kwoniella dejecticola CBS 10117]